jgi:iron complex transport system substrate-binding protein
VRSHRFSLRRLLAAVVIVLACAPLASGAEAATPERIVSLSPTATEMLYAIGAGPRVVAVDDQSNYPRHAPKTRLSAIRPNVEAIANYRPDLVVVATDTNNVVAALRRLRIRVMVNPAARRLPDSYAQIRRLGTATGRVPESNRLVSRMQRQVANVVRSLPRPRRALTYYHELDQSLFSATSRTFIGQVYALLGLRNVADEADKTGSGYPQLNAEFLIGANPDLIFLADTKCCGQNARTVAARPGWDAITAVQRGAIITEDDDIASRWGPRIVDFLRDVARRVAPYQRVQSAVR